METTTNHPCPSERCKKGKVKIVAQLYTESGFVPQEPVYIDCLCCEGKGYMNDEQKADYEARVELEKEFWCECEDKDNVDFYEDGEHPELSKHHVRHIDCGKVVQIG